MRVVKVGRLAVTGSVKHYITNSCVEGKTTKEFLFSAEGYRLEMVNIIQDSAGDVMVPGMASEGRSCQNIGTQLHVPYQGCTT